MNTLARLLDIEDILLQVGVASKASLFEEIGRHMHCRHGLGEEWVATSLARREQVGSTALGQGFGLPHARVTGVERILPVYARLARPIPFVAPDGQPVSEVLVLLVPKQAAEAHLTVLADATRLFSDSRFRAELNGCHEPVSIKRVFEHWAVGAE